MATRLVHQCDLCKVEFTSDDVWNIKISKKGTKKAGIFELCAKCAEKLQTDLISAKKAAPTPSPVPEVLSDKEAKIAALEAGDRFFPEINETRIGATPKGGLQEEDTENCSHMNKTRPRMSKDGFYRECRACGVKLPLKNKQENDALNSINIKDDDLNFTERD